ncbi:MULTISPECIES: TenA family protein [Aerosakkonema]|uniref:TenA family protein n=1 Tax=Aerosakkonema TaxID=1246629 RepID=UPI0035BB447C
MTVSSDLWQSNLDLAHACLKHPFVQGIAEGTLSKKRFAYYVGQDAFFLGAFARAYSVSAAKAPDWDGFATFHSLAGGVLEELRLHEGYAAQWGIDLLSVRSTPATRRYTDFLLATAWGSDIGVTATAMVPCLRLYSFLGYSLAENGIPDHVYGEWIRTYSSPEFVQLAEKLERLVDRYGTATTTLPETYRYAMLCERDFFQAAWDVESDTGID